MRDDTSTPHRAWLTYLDGWRGLSILGVLAGHFVAIPFMNTGRFGVEMFFCLSGRLMAGILFVEEYPLDKFIYRRVARVWPALYVFVIVVACACALSGSFQVKLVDVVGALTFTSNYTQIYFHKPTFLAHLWSLAVEEWAYVFLALIAYLCRRYSFRPVPLLVFAAICCVVNGWVQTAFGMDYYAVYTRTDVRISSILVPCALFLVTRGRSFPQWLPLGAGLAGLVLNLHIVPDPLKYSLGTLCLALAVSTIDLSPEAVRKLLSMRWLRMIGLWSFSLYLWQQPFANIGGQAPLRLAMAFACSLASFYILENPARRFLNGLLERRPPRAKAAPGRH